MDKSIPVFPVSQPIGTFYLGVLSAEELLRIGYVRQRSLNQADRENVQRKDNVRRTAEISLYLEDPDATFPTSIIISCNANDISIENNQLTFDDSSRIGEIVDGQHRFLGLERSDPARLKDFQLPVVFMIGLEPYEKAYVFSTINSKQTPVPKSLIYDLFELADHRSPVKLCHEVARTLNAKPNSPFYQGLKMLGNRTLDIKTEFLTQGSFVTELLHRITRSAQKDEINIKNRQTLIDDDSLPFRHYFINSQDELIVKILENYFGAIKDVFSVEWNQTTAPLPPTAPRFILRKTVGFKALMLAFDVIWGRAREKKTASYEFFHAEALQMKNNLGDIPLTSEMFASSGGTARELANYFLGIHLAR